MELRIELTEFNAHIPEFLVAGNTWPHDLASIASVIVNSIGAGPEQPLKL